MRLNLNPKIWGSHGWFFIDGIILGYPDKPGFRIKNAIKNFLISMQYLLPCQTCRMNFRKNLMYYPLTDKVLSSKNNLLQWSMNIQNEICHQNRNYYKFKSLKDVFKFYKKMYSELNSNRNQMNSLFNGGGSIVFIIFVVLLIFIFIFYRKKTS